MLQSTSPELVLSILSLPFDRLRAVSKVEPSKGRREVSSMSGRLKLICPFGSIGSQLTFRHILQIYFSCNST
jgi:hypothetical protein